MPRKTAKAPDLSNLHPDALRRIEKMPTSMRGTYIKAMSGNSKATAVKAMCMECTGYLRKSITECTSPGCPLYPYRPYQSKEEEECGS